MTVYRDDSELSRLNATAHRGPVEVEPRLFELLETAVSLSQETGGAYDVTSGPLSEAWGFVKGPKRVPDEATLAEALCRTGWQHLRLDRGRRTIAFNREGVRMNLGSIGKGYAIDRAAEIIRALVAHAGFGAWGSFQPLCPGITSRPARRTLGNRTQKPVATRIAAGHASAAESRARNLWRGLSAVRRRRSGLWPHHRPAVRPAGARTRQCDRRGATAALADALSTAFYLLGSDAAAAYVAEHPAVGVIIVEREASESAPRVVTFGLSENDFVAAPNSVN